MTIVFAGSSPRNRNPDLHRNSPLTFDINFDFWIRTTPSKLKARQLVPKYDFACSACGAYFETERSIAEAADPVICPVCETESRRVFTMPKLLFKADSRDIRPVWHNHERN